MVNYAMVGLELGLKDLETLLFYEIPDQQKTRIVICAINAAVLINMVFHVISVTLRSIRSA